MNIIRSQSVGAQLRYMLCILFGDQDRESSKAQLEKYASLHACPSLDQLFVDVSRHSDLATTRVTHF